MNIDIQPAVKRLMAGRGWSKVEAESFARQLTPDEVTQLAKLPVRPGALQAFLDSVHARLHPPAAAPIEKVEVKGKRTAKVTKASTGDGTLVPDLPSPSE